MPEPVVEIPNRPAFRASEVCELAQIPPYVLKSWEKEFPNLGVAPKPGAARVYRRADVEQVLRIKQLLFKEGLTLAGARRKLEGEPKAEEEPLPELPLGVGGDVRDKVARVKQELRSLLDFLSKPSQSTGVAKAADASASGRAAEAAEPSGSALHADSQPLDHTERDVESAPSAEVSEAADLSARPWPPVATQEHVEAAGTDADGAPATSRTAGGEPSDGAKPSAGETLFAPTADAAAAQKPVRSGRKTARAPRKTS